MKILLTTFCCLLMAQNTSWACSKFLVQKSKPPRLVDGQWVSDNSNDAKTKISNDFKAIKKKDYDFIFSGIYKKDISLNKQARGYIETKAIWKGSVPEDFGMNSSNQPRADQCDMTLLKFDKEYIFFGKLGSRNNPIRLKEFRTASFDLKQLLGKPQKQWLRGRLIQRR